MMDRDENGCTILMISIFFILLCVAGFYIMQSRYDMCMNNTYHTWWQCILLSVR